MASDSAPPFHILLMKMTFLIVVFTFIFLIYVDDLFLENTGSLEKSNKKDPSRIRRNGLAGFCGRPVLERGPATQKALMDLNNPPPFDLVEIDDILINEVNNEDLKMDVKLDDLFTKVGPRVDFLLLKSGKLGKKYPPGYQMSPDVPPPFDVGDDDVLINQVNNMTPKIFIHLPSLLPPIKRKEPEEEVQIGPVFSKPQMDLNMPPPYSNPQQPDDQLINEVNNTNEIEEVDVNIIFNMPFLGKSPPFLRNPFNYLNFSSSKRIFEDILIPASRFWPAGYSMDPHDPPPFDEGSNEPLINEVNNHDADEDIDLDELLGLRPKKPLKSFRKKDCRKRRNKSPENPRDYDQS